MLLFFVITSLYFYVFHPEATLYFLATLFSRSTGELLSGKVPNDYPNHYELYDLIIPYKRPVFFAQFALIVSLFVYTRFIRRRFNLIVVKVIYWMTILLIIFFTLLTLAMPIIPYGGMVG
jgi:hypothetical protein